MTRFTSGSSWQRRVLWLGYGVRRLLAGSAVGETLGAGGAFLVLDRAGWLPGVSLPALLVMLAIAASARRASEAHWPQPTRGVDLYCRTGIYMCGTGAVIYLTGWGPMLAIGYMYAVADSIRHSGSRAAVPCLVWSVVSMTAGEAAIALGLAPTRIAPPTIHALALLSLLGVLFAIVLMRSLTREKEQVQEALATNERRFRSLVQNATDIITVLDPDGRIRYTSPSSERLLGYKPEEWIGADAMQLVHPDDRARVFEALSAVVDQSRLPTPIEFRLRHADGSWRYLEAQATNLLHDPDVRGIVENVRDVTERRQFEEQLAHEAFHDALTDLPNRALFLDRLDQALQHARWRPNRGIGVLFLDLDRFKVINDSLGHGAGDALLVAAAARIAGCAEPGNTVARLGGDEFTVLLDDVDEGEALRIAEAIVAAFAEPLDVAGTELFVSVSVGVVHTTAPDVAGAELLRRADVALYQGKAAGRARAVLFDAGMDRATVARLDHETALRHAQQRGELRLFVQPEIDLGTGDVVGGEALVRWQRGETLVPPAEFIPLAEETGLILPIGRWVLETACRQTATWRRQGIVPPDFVVSVNISARQLQQPDLADEVGAALAAAGLPADCLRLELTESMLMERVAVGVERLHALRRLGVRLAIDDFGTGYSSLSYLTQLPVDTLKVDRSFVRGLDRDRATAAVVQATLALAHTLGIEVTAEGIESEADGRWLSAMGCERGQGYYFARPVPVEEWPATQFAAAARARTITSQAHPERPPLRAAG